MGHDHAGHNHAPTADADRRYLGAALALLVAYMVGEVGVAVWTGSLALLSDAAHMVTDAAAVALALWTTHLTARPARGQWTFGWQRAEILSGLANGVTLLVLGLVLGVEGVWRLVTPPRVEATPVLVTALSGIVVNVLVAWLLARADRRSLNVEGAYRHVLTDLFGFVGTALAAVVVLVFGWMRADALATLVVVGLMLHAGWGLVVASGRVLLEAAPAETDLCAIRGHLLELEHVIDVHDLHVWSVTTRAPALSAHLVVADACFHGGRAPGVLDEALTCLTGHFDLEHSTFQLEPASHMAHEHGVHEHAHE